MFTLLKWLNYLCNGDIYDKNVASKKLYLNPTMQQHARASNRVSSVQRRFPKHEATADVRMLNSKPKMLTLISGNRTRTEPRARTAPLLTAGQTDKRARGSGDAVNSCDLAPAVR